MCLLYTLFDNQSEPRSSILRLFQDEALFRPEVLALPPGAFATLADFIIEVCTAWRWA